MLRTEIMEKLTGLFREVFDDESIVLEDSTSAKDIVGWDSLMHITILSEIEDEFDISFPMKEKTTMKNVGEIVDKIASLL